MNKIGHLATPSRLSMMARSFRALIFIGAIFFGNCGFASAEENDAAESPQAIPYDILEEQDSAIKRETRMRGLRMRELFGPELAWHSSFVEADDQTGSRHFLGGVMPLSELWEFSLIDQLSFFSLRDDDKSAGRESLTLRVGMTPGQDFRPWLSIQPYFNFDEAKGEGVGLSAGFANSWKNGASMTAEAYAWRPWDEGYDTIVEDGRKHGVAASFILPFTQDFQLSARAFYEELDLGPGAKSGSQYAGHRYVINATAYYRLLHRQDAYMDYGFRNDDLLNEYLVGSELGIFARADFQRYTKPDGFDALNPEPEVFAQEVGLSFQCAISPRVGVSGEAYIGADPDRDNMFGELYGGHGRLTIVLNPHFRVWTEASYQKTGSNLVNSSGQETIFSVGLNYAF